MKFFLAYVHVHCGSERALPNIPQGVEASVIIRISSQN